MTYELTRPILFQHCDPAGIVFYPRYFELANEVVETWFGTELGQSFAEMHGALRLGVPTVVVSAHFAAPSRLGDTINLRLTVAKVGRTSADLLITGRGAGEDDARFTIRPTLVCIDLDTGRPQPWASAVSATMARFAAPS